jgi:26S proteasome regulatory subunit N7
MESAGDMEVMDARSEYARFAARSLSQPEAVAAYEQLVATPKVSSGKKIDAWMACARIASFYGDTVAVDEAIQKAHELAEAGGGADWDRRNRLKVYRALQKLLHRDIEGAAALLLDGIATFSCTEICTYTEFIVYAILTNLLYLPRPQLKKKIIDGPEILSVAAEIPVVVRTQYMDRDRDLLALYLRFFSQTNTHALILFLSHSRSDQIGSILLRL